jgi:hypothetical protein
MPQFSHIKLGTVPATALAPAATPIQATPYNPSLATSLSHVAHVAPYNLLGPEPQCPLHPCLPTSTTAPAAAWPQCQPPRNLAKLRPSHLLPVLPNAFC